MKNKSHFYLFFAIFFAITIEMVSYLWRNGSILDAQIKEKYFIGALLIFVFGGLELLSLHGLRKEVRQMSGKNKRWKSIVEFIFTMNCIGIPIYLVVFLINGYCQ